MFSMGMAAAKRSASAAMAGPSFWVLKYLGHRKFGMLPVDLRRIVNHQKLFQVINKFMTFV
jgi:hypothetical protein